MRTKLISSSNEPNEGYGAGSGSIERYEYECPCGKGTIVEDHDNIPGFRDHTIFICCDECKEKYEIDTSKGVHGWELAQK